MKGRNDGSYGSNGNEWEQWEGRTSNDECRMLNDEGGREGSGRWSERTTGLTDFTPPEKGARGVGRVFLQMEANAWPVGPEENFRRFPRSPGLRIEESITVGK
jgi:hypothetical protein